MLCTSWPLVTNGNMHCRVKDMVSVWCPQWPCLVQHCRTHLRCHSKCQDLQSGTRHWVTCNQAASLTTWLQELTLKTCISTSRLSDITNTLLDYKDDQCISELENPSIWTLASCYVLENSYPQSDNCIHGWASFQAQIPVAKEYKKKLHPAR